MLSVLRPYCTLLQGLGVPWAFGGGWACDAWTGRQSRAHADVDIVIWRADQPVFQSYFADWTWQTHAGGAARPWPQGTLLALPAHNAHGRKGGQEFEVLMQERAGEDWWYRRDPRVRMLAEQAMLLAPTGLPVLNPAIALLFKSKKPQPKDQHDFETVLPDLRSEDRIWLRRALLTSDPEHAWIDRL